MPKGFYPILDAVLVFVGFALAYYVRYELQIIRPVFDPNRAPFEPYLPYTAVFAFLLFLHYQGSGLYKSNRGRSWLEEIYALGNGVTNATVVVLGMYFVFQPLVFSRLMLVYVAVIVLSCWRFALFGESYWPICVTKVSAYSGCWSSAREMLDNRCCGR